MTDLATMLWKEFAEFLGNRRSLRVFAIAVGIFGLLPTLGAARHIPPPLRDVVLPMYVLVACAIVVAQTAPDLVLRERTGHSLEYLLASRLSDGAIFGGKVITAAVMGCVAALLTVALQIVSLNLHGGGGTVGAATAGGIQWLYLASPQGRLLAFLGPVLLAAYLATVGTFVALRVGDQRAAYMVTMLSVGVLVLPFVLKLITPHVTLGWMEGAALVFAVLDLILVGLGIGLFRRERLVLYLQD